MRPEVLTALHIAQHQQRSTYWATNEPEVGKDYSFLLTDEQRSRLERVSTTYACIRACLSALFPDLTMYGGSSTSICIEEARTPHFNIVVELSLYEALAAPFVYGQPPTKVLTVLHECLASCGVIALDREEIDELEQQGLFLELFE